MFMGDRLTIPASDAAGERAVQERSGRAAATCRRQQTQDRAYQMSMRQINEDDNTSLEDEVEIVEIYVPSANAIVTVPGLDKVLFEDYLRVDDFYGVKEGPYTFLALTPPVPGNPLPVPSVGIWNDLHVWRTAWRRRSSSRPSVRRTSMATSRRRRRRRGASQRWRRRSVKVDDPAWPST
jgi:hypothetical protein